MSLPPELRARLLRDGYCVVPDVLPRETVTELRGIVGRLAVQERDAGVAWYSNGNQRVFALLNRHSKFVALAEHPRALEIVEDILGTYVLLSSITAHLVRPGNVAQALHADQDYVASPWPGPLVVNLLWVLDAFTPENGATVVLPGSQCEGESPTDVIAEKYVRVPVVASAGSVIVVDGRVWHGSGRNPVGGSDRVGLLACYCAPYLRQQENHFRSLPEPVRWELSGRMRRLLGYEAWQGLGVVGGLPPSWSGKSTRSGLVNADLAFRDVGQGTE
jgi:ectoine hydroxylase-related dioxygenase (phytanoyl-CoA dioxygenase family)